MNTISNQLITGTLGELLVQLRLLQFGVQAAAPLKDSGNDLIAVMETQFRAVQVKTTQGSSFTLPHPHKKYDILAVVKLSGRDDEVFLDESKVFLLRRDETAARRCSFSKIQNFMISRERVQFLFGNQAPSSSGSFEGHDPR